jgi:DNA-binding transcriptional MerR regulator
VRFVGPEQSCSASGPGFTLEEIARLLDGAPPWQRLARQKLKELDGRIDELRRAVGLLESALECGCRRLETCDRAEHLACLEAPRASLSDEEPVIPRARDVLYAPGRSVEAR